MKFRLFNLSKLLTLRVILVLYILIVIYFLLLLLFCCNSNSIKWNESHNIAKSIISRKVYNKLFINERIVHKGNSLRYHQSIYNYAYVSFVTTGKKYFDLINATICSVHFFSKYPIILYVSGKISKEMLNLFYMYDRLLVYSIQSEENNVYFMKLRAAILAPVLVGQIVESDTIVLPGADCLFKRIEEEITKEYPFPMMPRHNDIRGEVKGNGTINTLDYPMKNRSMRYMHAHMSWTYLAIPFIAKIYTKSYSFKYNNDEYALNVNLWESHANKQWCRYDPFYSIVDVSENNKIFKNTYENYVFYNFLHGCKSQFMQNLIINKLKRARINRFKMIYSINNSLLYLYSCKVEKEMKKYLYDLKCII